jgi:hypothetical protein
MKTVMFQMPEHNPRSNDLGIYNGAVVVEKQVFEGHLWGL